jgi:hypothetical protein
VVLAGLQSAGVLRQTLVQQLNGDCSTICASRYLFDRERNITVLLGTRHEGRLLDLELTSCNKASHIGR